MSGETNYNSWTKAGLVQRLRELEGELKRRPEAPKSVISASAENEAPVGPGGEKKKVKGTKVKGTEVKGTKGKRKMDPSRYSSRFIALKLAYLGKNYGGFEFQAMGNQPSIEEELWNALVKACLIFPEDERVVQFDCCEYSKCGRTDRGVSAFGQVIGLRVRSNRPLPKKRAQAEEDAAGGSSVSGDATLPESREITVGGAAAEDVASAEEDEVPFDDIQDELCYPRILNRLLPDDIRILAWCPSPPPDFSARFSCRERQYRYFFTQPAFAPDPTDPESPGIPKPGWLDIDAMRDAAKRYEGDNDFRNFCKIDPAKQITNFRRRIFESDIVQVQDAGSVLPYLQSQGYCPSTATALDPAGPYPKVYYFHVRGSAFLWHQIRHMVAILFLVGQGLERPSLVSELLDTDKSPSRPSYVMADEVPLVLWDCIFPDLSEVDHAAADAPDRRTDCMDWIYVGEEYAPNKFGQFGVMESTWKLWRGCKMDELLSAQLLQMISQQGGAHSAKSRPLHLQNEATNAPGVKQVDVSARIFEGGNGGRLGGRYVPVMKKELLQPPGEQNDGYARRKGYADAADMRAKKGMGRNASRDDDE